MKTLRHTIYAWGFVRSMSEEEKVYFNSVNKNLPGEKKRILFIDSSNCGHVVLERGRFTPFGFARRVKGGFIVAKYDRYDKYCDDGTLLKDVEDR